MSAIRYPDVTVTLVGEDGNAFAILGKVQRALRDAGHEDAAAEFHEVATSGDYDHLLATALQYVDVQ